MARRQSITGRHRCITTILPGSITTMTGPITDTISVAAITIAAMVAITSVVMVTTISAATADTVVTVVTAVVMDAVITD
jgi:hypothetical protein